MLSTIGAATLIVVVIMSIRNAIASIAVKNLNSASPWYERLMGRGPDRVSAPDAVEWICEQGGRLQLHQQPSRAGLGSVVLAVGNLDAEVLQLSKWGIGCGEVTRSSAARTLIIEDPDGNIIALAEMLPPATNLSAPTISAGDGTPAVHPLEQVSEKIAQDPKFGTCDVRKFLDGLILDLEALLRASEENMNGTDAGLAAQLLQRAHVARDKIAPPLAAI
jgi:hypothetical protein